MKRYCFLLILGIFIGACNTGIQPENNLIAHADEIVEVQVVNEPEFINVPRNYYSQFIYELHRFPEQGAYVQDSLEMRLNWVVNDDSQLPHPDMEYVDVGEGLLISPRIVNDTTKLKVVMFKALTLRLNLGLTESDSKILEDRGVNYDYTLITQEDYTNLLRLIVERFNQ